jgi:uncharacterized protein (DUF983 family)
MIAAVSSGHHLTGGQSPLATAHCRIDASSPAPPGVSAGRMLFRGLARRCPVCGEAKLFSRWFTMVDRCPRCGLRFERIEGHWLGALGLNTIVSFVALFVVVVAGLLLSAPDFEMTPLLGASVATAVLVPLVFFPSSKTLWTAIDVLMRPLEPGEAHPPAEGEVP